MSGEICSRCGGSETLARGRRECVARAAADTAAVAWDVAVCGPCALKNVAEDLRRVTRVAPFKGSLLAILGLGCTGVALISLTEPGLAKLWAIPFAFLGVPVAIRGIVMVVTIPFALDRLGSVKRRLASGDLSEKDRDLLVHLEAHRVLCAVQTSLLEVHGNLALPEIADADPERVSYDIRKPAPA